MMLVEQTTVPTAALPVQALKDHLRLGTGFADDVTQDGLVESCLRAAIAAVERRTSKALLSRTYLWTVSAWRDLGRQVLPVAPVTSVSRLSIVDRTGGVTDIAPDRYRLQPDLHRPTVVAMGLVLPTIPVGGHAEIVFEAGFGPDWSAVPADLAQAVMILAAQFYEGRHDPNDATALPAQVGALIERFRNVRLFGGGWG